MKFSKNFPIFLMVGLLLIITIPMIPSTLVEEKPSTSALPAILTTEPPRNETVWMTGSYNSPTQFLPWSTSLPPGADAGMYEALFGYNSVTEEVVPCIGTSFEWSGTGENVTIELNPNAEWSDGETLDADDVVYSYKLAQNQSRYTVDFSARFADFVKVDTDTIRFDMKSGYEFSRKVESWLMYNIPIVPEHIWTEIVAAKGGDISTYQYDWFDETDVPDEWKVISGPYAPVYRDATESTCAYQYREDWWGAGILYQDIPNAAEEPPKYIGTTRFASNTEQDLAFIQGDIDLYAGYYHHIWEIWEEAEEGDPGSYIYCWYGRDPPYQLAMGGLINLAPNHVLPNSPLGVREFRQALAYGINYDPIPDAAASGYWTQAKPGFLDNNSFLQAPYYNASVTAAYEKYLNVTKATELLEGIPGMVHNPDGTWEYNGAPVGPYDAICPVGWTDAILFTEMVTQDITDNLNITITTIQVDYDYYKTMIESSIYDFAMFLGGQRISETPIRFLNGMRGEHLYNKNVTSWSGPYADMFEDLWQTLETANETEYANNLDIMQAILAYEVPEIPGFVNGYWYAFSEYLWEGWASEANKFQQLVTTWTNDQFVIKTRLMLNLNSTGRGAEEEPGAPVISIKSPSMYDIFGMKAPKFNIEVEDGSIDSMWYTIDGGINNRTFSSNITIDQELWGAAGNGTVSIDFYVNNTSGNVGNASVIVRKDVYSPFISIKKPTDGNVFGNFPPIYDITVDEPNLETMWYTIDGGATNISFSCLNGIIDEQIWHDAPDGPITIIFYARDVVNNTGSAEVELTKYTLPSLNLDIIDLSCSKDSFNLTFFVYNETKHGIDFVTFQIWWNGIDVSADVQNLGNGYYFVSLDPITVAPGEDPIVLSITISALGFEDKHFEINIAVDPDSLLKGDGGPTGEFPWAFIIIISALSAGAVIGVISIYWLRRRKREP